MTDRTQLNILRQTMRCLLVLAVLCAAGPALGHEQPGWAKHGGNPVLEPGEHGEWDHDFVFLPSMILDGSTYHMWYAGCGGEPQSCSVGYSTSPDGSVWTKHPDNPVLAPGAEGSWDAGVVEPGTVLFDGGETYTMWYYGSAVTTPEQGTGIGMATSTDGVSWTRYAGNPVLPGGGAGAWDETVDYPSVVFDGESYHMWYIGGPTSSSIGYASSPDGIAWTRHPDNPVLEGNAGERAWDERLLSVEVMLDGDTYHMLYSGDTQTTEGAIGYASSPDGIVWTRDGGQGGPVLAPSVLDADWDHCNIGYHGLLTQGAQVWMYYSGWVCGIGIGLATAGMDELSIEYSRANRLNRNRFEVQTLWWDSQGNVDTGVPVKLTDDTGSFWFFDSANLELMVKVLDGCFVNGHYWVYAAGLTDVGVNLIVTDLWTGERVTYASDLGEAFQPILDSSAFAVCD